MKRKLCGRLGALSLAFVMAASFCPQTLAASKQSAQATGFENNNTSLNMTQVARYDSGMTNADGGVMEIVDYNLEQMNALAYSKSIIIQRNFWFNENDVKQICLKHDLNFESAKLWYDGYHLGNEDIYNPYSITQLTLERLYTSYWIRTGSFEHVLKVINQNVDGIRDLILSLMSGNKYQNIDTTKFKNPIVEIKDRNTALIYLVHLGYLTFKQNADGTNEISIPNEEVRQVFVSNIDTSQRPTA